MTFFSTKWFFSKPALPTDFLHLSKWQLFSSNFSCQNLGINFDFLLSHPTSHLPTSPVCLTLKYTSTQKASPLVFYVSPYSRFPHQVYSLHNGRVSLLESKTNHISLLVQSWRFPSTSSDLIPPSLWHLLRPLFSLLQRCSLSAFLQLTRCAATSKPLPRKFFYHHHHLQGLCHHSLQVSHQM